MWIPSDGRTASEVRAIEARREREARDNARIDLVKLCTNVGVQLRGEPISDTDMTVIAEAICDALYDSPNYGPILKDGPAVDGYALAAETLKRAAQPTQAQGEAA